MERPTALLRAVAGCAWGCAWGGEGEGAGHVSRRVVRRPAGNAFVVVFGCWGALAPCRLTYASSRHHMIRLMEQHLLLQGLDRARIHYVCAVYVYVHASVAFWGAGRAVGTAGGPGDSIVACIPIPAHMRPVRTISTLECIAFGFRVTILCGRQEVGWGLRGLACRVAARRSCGLTTVVMCTGWTKCVL